MPYNIRPVNDDDADAIVSIFNYYVENSFAAYPDNKVGIEFYNTMKNLSVGYPFYIAETENNEVAGFALIRPYHRAETIRRTAEITYFIDPKHTGKGIGEKFFNKLIESAKALGIDNILASISSLNEGSINFHIKHDFVECGRFRRAGKKQGHDFDIVWMQKFI